MKRYKFALENKGFELSTYRLDELPNSSKEKAIQEHLDFLNSIGYECENESGELETIYDYLEICNQSDINEVVENIAANEYEYNFNGELAGIITYIRDNRPTGKKTIRLNGQEINLLEI